MNFGVYQKSFVEEVKWVDGEIVLDMTGDLSTYYANYREKIYVDTVTYDENRAYIGLEHSNDSIGRVLRKKRPGVFFGSDTTQVTFPTTNTISFGYLDYKYTLDLKGIPQDSFDRFSNMTKNSPWRGYPTSSTDIHDAFGRTVGSITDTIATTTQYLYGESDGVFGVDTQLPNYYSTAEESDDFVLSSRRSDLLSQYSIVTSPDTGKIQKILNMDGKVAFQMDASGAAESPNCIQYNTYDRLGRIVESGVIQYSSGVNSTFGIQRYYLSVRWQVYFLMVCSLFGRKEDSTM